MLSIGLSLMLTVSIIYIVFIYYNQFPRDNSIHLFTTVVTTFVIDIFAKYTAENYLLARGIFVTPQ